MEIVWAKLFFCGGALNGPINKRLGSNEVRRPWKHFGMFFSLNQPRAHAINCKPLQRQMGLKTLLPSNPSEIIFQNLQRMLVTLMS